LQNVGIGIGIGIRRNASVKLQRKTFFKGNKKCGLSALFPVDVFHRNLAVKKKFL
jgi:hypothetical protein